MVRKSPRAARAEQLAQRQREAQINALRREGIYLEEEYREEIRYYMHEMEVSIYSGARLVQPKTHHTRAFTALHYVFYSIDGSATRNSLAHAPMPG